MTMHKMKNGQKIAIADMDDNHLRNTIAMIERRATEGVKVQNGGGGVFGEWYDEYTLYGDDALGILNHSAYVDELAGRANK